MFEAHQCLRAVIEAVLEGRQGKIITPGRDAGAVRLDLGCYAIPGGDAFADEVPGLVQSVGVGVEILVADEVWRRQIEALLGGRFQEAPMNGYLPGPRCVELSRAWAEKVPVGYQVLPLDLDWAHAITREHNPNGLSVFETSQRLVTDGFGVVAVKDGELACLSTTYCLSSTKAEISIATAPAHRGKGLAACVAGQMLQVCFERGLEPHWNASNPVSQRLAARLGFEKFCVVDIIKPL